MSFVEVALVAGVAYCRPSDFLVGGVIGLACSLPFTGRRSPSRLAFNIAEGAVGLGIVELLYWGVLGPAGPLSTRAWGASYLAVLAAEIVAFAAVVAVIWLTTGSADLPAVATVGGLTVAVTTTNTALGLVIVLLLAVAPWGVLLLGGVALILAVVYRQYTTVRLRYANLRLLYAFGGALADTQAGEDVLRCILEQSADLLRAERTELTLPSGSGWVRILLDDHGDVARDHLHAPSLLVTTALREHAGVLVPAGSHHPLRPGLADDGDRDAIATTVAADADQVGALVAFNRQGDVRTFDGEDLALFQALANHASVALRNSQLLDRLTEEAAHRAHQAMHDALTGLGNRELFADRVRVALADPDQGPHVAVMLMDLDEFKEINDTLGHHTGDKVLREIGARLSRIVGTRGVVARLGGDEFAVSFPGCRDAEEATALAGELRRAVEDPIVVEDLSLELHVSVGVALSPEHGEDPAALLQRADVAMYSAKGARRGLELYSADKDHYSQRRLALSGELRRAIDGGDLTLAFQPKASLVDGCITGVEALVRWHHPRHGFVPPDEFIPVAEQSGLIQPLTRWVLGEALRQVAAWRAAGLDLTVAVNLSARSLLDAALVDEIARALKTAGAPPSALVLELTETTVMSDPDRSQVVLQQLFDLGCRLSIDDFGTGYSSLSRLKQLPVDEVKIDKSFVLNMATDTEDAAIVRSIIDLARNLGLRVVAEGVEDDETARCLQSLGCDLIQGYFLCRPQPAQNIGDWMASQLVRRTSPRPTAPAAGGRQAVTLGG